MIKPLIGAGSENPRLKHWDRGRYGKLQLNKWDMNEYVFHVNIGNDMVPVIHGLSVANGGHHYNQHQYRNTDRMYNTRVGIIRSIRRVAVVGPVNMLRDAWAPDNR